MECYIVLLGGGGAGTKIAAPWNVNKTKKLMFWGKFKQQQGLYKLSLAALDEELLYLLANKLFEVNHPLRAGVHFLNNSHRP